MKTDLKVDGPKLEAAKAFERVMSSRPVEEQLCVAMIAENVVNGCSWEMVRMNDQLRRAEEDFRNSKVCSLQKITYDRQAGVKGYLVYMQFDKLLELLSPKNSGPLNEKVIKVASDHRDEALRGFTKLIMDGYTGRVGIFCTNDSQTITIKGHTYPAFSVTLKEMCTILAKFNYGVVVSGEPRDPQQVLQREDAVIESLLVAPSSNALFIEVAPMGKKYRK